ncbi:MAG: glycosyltransferase family 2 protein, partial [Actinobacteria bacterium]|nr:glycosyltransferase family 2 protein [Actinomycetota bacterium]
AMAEGLGVLEGSGHSAAAAARVGQMLRMDVPRLAEIARTHPDDEYRRTLGAFARDLLSRPGTARLPLDGSAATAVSGAALW